MLATGSYPEYLKARIAADNGHLDNNVTAAFISEIISPRLRNLYLCHLSHDNNLPQIALHTIEEAISQRDDALILLQGLRLVALPRYAATPLYTL